jgi:hypothetical protein
VIISLLHDSDLTLVTVRFIHYKVCIGYDKNYGGQVLGEAFTLESRVLFPTSVSMSIRVLRCRPL